MTEVSLTTGFSAPRIERMKERRGVSKKGDREREGRKITKTYRFMKSVGEERRFSQC